MQKMKKKIGNQFLCFLTALDLIWPKLCPKSQTHFTYVWRFNWCQWLVLQSSMSSSEKNYFLSPICIKKGSLRATPKIKKTFFFGRNDKSRSSSFRNFLLYQNIICFDWVMNLLSILGDFFCKKSASSSQNSWGTISLAQLAR